MKPLSLVSFLLLVCLLFTYGCGSSDGFACSQNIVDGIVVSVVDAQTHASLAADAVVTIQDGSYTETLRPFSFDASGTVLSQAGAAERPGTYTVRVTRAGYTSFEKQNVVVTRNACHVNAVGVTAELQPAP